MGKTKDRPEYQAVSLPKDIVEKVRIYVLNNDKYNSIAEFTKRAVLEKMEMEVAVSYESRLTILEKKVSELEKKGE